MSLKVKSQNVTLTSFHRLYGVIEYFDSVYNILRKITCKNSFLHVMKSKQFSKWSH